MRYNRRMRLYLNVGVNTLYQVLARVTTAIVGFIAIRFIIGSLGVDGFGDYQIVITYVTLFWIVTDFGLNAIAVREMAAKEEELAENFAALLTLRGMLGVILLGLSWAILIFLPYSQHVTCAILIGSTTIFFQSLLGSVNGLFQVKLRYDRQLISNALGSAVSLSLVILAAQQSWGLMGFIFAFVSTSVTMALVNIMLAYQWVQVKVSRDTARLRYLFKETLPFGTALLFSLATFKLDALLLSFIPLTHIENNIAVGIYNLSFKVFELVLILPVFFMNPVYPILVKHLQDSPQKFKQSVRKAVVALMLAAIGVIVVVYPLSGHIVTILADSPGFDDSVALLQLLVLWTPLFFLSAVFMWILVTLRNQRALIIVYAVGFVVNLITNLIFLPQYHYFGAVYTTGFSELVILVMLIVFVFRSWRKLE